MIQKSQQPKKLKAKKPFTGFKINVRSRHPSHSPARTQLPKLPFRSIVRFGSTTELTDGKKRVECNNVQAIQNSSSKLLMKNCFIAANIKTALWAPLVQVREITNETIKIIGTPDFELKYPIVTKSLHGSRGLGNTIHKNTEEFRVWFNNHKNNFSNYIVEQFYDYNREYRLHVTKDGCFYTCRKMLKEDTPEDKRWFRNDSNSTWILEDNPKFDKPVNWNAIVAESVKALNAVGLDVGAMDVKVQSAKDKKGNVRTNPEFIILETNSAPSWGTVTTQKYLEIIPKILKTKYAAGN